MPVSVCGRGADLWSGAEVFDWLRSRRLGEFDWPIGILIKCDWGGLERNFLIGRDICWGELLDVECWLWSRDREWDSLIG